MPFPSQSVRRAIPGAGILLAAGLAAGSLWLWIVGSWELLTTASGRVPMAPSTALALLGLCAAIGLQTMAAPGATFPRERSVARVATGLTAFLATSAFLRTWTGWVPPHERWLAGDAGQVDAIPLGLMSPLTAGALLLLSAGVLLRDAKTKTGIGAGRAAAATVLAGCVAVFGTYLLDVPLLYDGSAIPMAASTSLVLVALSGSLLLGRGLPPRPRAGLPGAWWPVAAAVGVTLGIATVSGYFARRELAEAEIRARAYLDAVADLKQEHVELWRRERLAEARFVQESPHVLEDVRALIANAPSEELRRRVAHWGRLSGDDYTSIAVYDAGKDTVLEVDGGSGIGMPTEDLRSICRDGRAVITDLHTGPADESPRMEAICPLRDRAAADAPSRYALLLRIAPERSLLGICREWPAPSRTGEILIARREGEEVVYLTPSQASGGQRLWTRRPIDRRSRLPAVLAALGERGVVAGVDLDGEPVLADVRSVPNSPWFMVTKIHRDEIRAPQRDAAWTMLGLTAALALAGWLIADAAQRRRETQFLRAELYARTAAEAALRDRNRLLTMLEAGVNEIYVFRPDDLRFEYVNRSAADNLGLPLERLLQMTPLDLMPEFTEERLRAQVAPLLAGEAPTLVFPSRHRRADGTTYEVEVHLQCVAKTTDPRFLATTLDLTERRRIEEQVRDALAFNQLVLTHAPIGILTYRASGPCVMANPAAAEVTGGTVEQLQAQNFRTNETWERLGLLHAAEQALAGDQVVRREFRGVTTFGKEIWYETVFLSFMARHEPHLLLLVQDVAKRRTAEERLRHAEKLNAIGQLAGGVAHDFNNQLTGITGFAELLARRESDPASKQYVESILECARRSADLVRKLLAFARKGRYQPTPVGMHRSIGETVTLLEHSLDKRIHIEQALNAARDVVLGDPSQLQSALLNLALNARDAMPAGGTLTFATDSVTLSESQEATGAEGLPPGEYLQVVVRDTGCGMSEAVQRHLFEPFFTTKEPGKGTGMGLASVYGTVTHHGGTVRIASQEGKGTAVTVLLPLTKAAPEPGVEPAPHPALPRLHLLVIDDESLVRRLFVRMLEGDGHEVSAAADGREAVEVYRARWQRIDLVVLDLTMPDAHAGDVLPRLREVNPAVRVLLTSGHGPDGEVQEILASGARGFLQKPFSLAELRRQVTHALGRTEN